MTEQTQPTDAEIEAAWTAATGCSILPYPGDMLAFARAVLAKWGTPAGAGERVYLVATGLTNDAGTVELYERHDRFVPLADCEVLYTTPQPTQAQAGAVPLTDEQSKALVQARSTAMHMAAAGRIPECGDFAAIAQNLDWLCDSLGIKGADHA